MQRQIPLAINVDEGDVSGHATNINVFPERTEGGKYGFTLKSREGFAFHTQLDNFTGVKALHKVGDIESGERAFALTDTALFEIFDNGTSINHGAVSLFGTRVVCTDNGLQIVFVDGLKGYTFNLATNEVTEIVSEGFYPARTVTYQDGYFIFERTGTKQFFISQLLSATFDAADFASAEGQPDNVVGVISDHRELFLFGSCSTEVWYNSGDNDFPFDRSQGAFIEKGCAAPYSIQKQNNTVYFIGSDLMVYSLSGYTPVRISTHAVEKDLKGINLLDTFAYTYALQGHLFYVLTIPVRQKTWVYDISLGVWHIRSTKQFGRDLANNVVEFNGKILVGDFQAGVVYQMTMDALDDNGDEIERVFVLPTVNMGRKIATFGSLEIDMTTGLGQTNGPYENPSAVLEFSKDKAQTWSNQKFASLGRKGEYTKRVKWNRLGSARNMDFRITISGKVRVDIGGAWVEVS